MKCNKICLTMESHGINLLFLTNRWHQNERKFYHYCYIELKFMVNQIPSYPISVLTSECTHWSVILQINKCCLTFLATWQQFYYIVIKDGIYGKISLLVTYNIICHVSDNCFWLDTEKNTTTYVYYGLHNSDRIVTVHLETFLHFAKWDMLETLL